MAQKKSKKFETLHDLFILKLQSLYDIENEIVKALPKFAKKATDGNLQAAFEKHLAETERQVTRLEEALKEIDAPIKKEKVEAIRGLSKDAAWIMQNVKDDAARDAALIAAAQYVEHYEMAGYGAASEWARNMGHDSVVSLLEDTLAEEKAADAKLNELALSGINDAANTIP
jgi:ferritin-like metal-binding protein YciE